MWFTNMESRQKSVRIAGIALDNKTVADFMVRLEKSGLFSDVDLKTLKQRKVGKSNLKSFQISCRKKPPVKTKTAQHQAKIKAKK
jgi:type IV pilus assembly protein PilN